MVIASHIEGRIRIRDDSLKKEALLGRVQEALLEMPGVSGVEGNLRVGSLLVMYSAATEAKRIVNAVAALLAFDQGADNAAASPGLGAETRGCSLIPPRLKSRVRRNIVNLGMLASLLLSLVAAVFDLKKLHILAGIVFVAFFGDHLYERRQMVFG